MVIHSSSPMRTKKARVLGIPVIDLGLERPKLCELIVKACEEFGFFQVENHGISREVISRVEKEGLNFFSKPACDKQRARPRQPSPFGYGCKDIGFNGDKGELEFILLEANPHLVSQRAKSLSSDPKKFSRAVNDYVRAVSNLACDILEIAAEGLWVPEKSTFSHLIRNPTTTDSCFRINHYPSSDDVASNHNNKPRIGFGEHTDPQVLTILWSNDVWGLQILSREGLWVPIPPDSERLCVFVGDSLEALTNGKFQSVRHRAVLSSCSVGNNKRMSMMYFAAPSLDARVSPVEEMVSEEKPSVYREFTWGEYKRAVYSLRLADNRLDMFRV
ncbi:Gibberellin 2-beta-dioxygenase 6 [Striga hermonthica]|uniref:gibberellin 2beta-dioxygenase n=1 Tax=Striga hermonthica TaxID=68872 RepID=A0A9N7N2D1_STRHE|nr:Gibberellin 2-beta-dioxygenase 6 [Striga hermonthica]